MEPEESVDEAVRAGIFLHAAGNMSVGEAVSRAPETAATLRDYCQWSEDTGQVWSIPVTGVSAVVEEARTRETMSSGQEIVRDRLTRRGSASNELYRVEIASLEARWFWGGLAFITSTSIPLALAIAYPTRLAIFIAIAMVPLTVGCVLSFTPYTAKLLEGQAKGVAQRQRD